MQLRQRFWESNLLVDHSLTGGYWIYLGADASAHGGKDWSLGKLKSILFQIYFIPVLQDPWLAEVVWRCQRCG